MRYPVLGELMGHDRVGHGAFHAFIRQTTPAAGPRSDMEYVRILSVLEEENFRTMWSVGAVKLERLMEVRGKARELVKSQQVCEEG
jgi:hypothetical protein